MLTKREARFRDLETKGPGFRPSTLLLRCLYILVFNVSVCVCMLSRCLKPWANCAMPAVSGSYVRTLAAGMPSFMWVRSNRVFAGRLLYGRHV